MPRPKIVALDLQDFDQRDEQGSFENRGRTPAFEPGHESTRAQPVRSERQPALRMIRRAQSVKAPQVARQEAVLELFSLAPPVVPNPAKVMAGAGLRAVQFGWQQS